MVDLEPGLYLNNRANFVAEAVCNAIQTITGGVEIVVNNKRRPYELPELSRRITYFWNEFGRLDSDVFLSEKKVVLRGGYDQNSDYLYIVEIDDPEFNNKVQNQISDFLLNGLCYPEDSK